MQLNFLNPVTKKFIEVLILVWILKSKVIWETIFATELAFNKLKFRFKFKLKTMCTFTPEIQVLITPNEHYRLKKQIKASKNYFFALIAFAIFISTIVLYLRSKCGVQMDHTLFHNHLVSHSEVEEEQIKNWVKKLSKT